LPIFPLERILGLDIENEERDPDDVDSGGGMIMVKKMSGPRILLVRIYPREHPSAGKGRHEMSI
jgi:hypothetical protein